MFQLYPHPVNHGFAMTFNNNVTVSVRWGELHYSNGKTTAEVAAMVDGDFVCVPGYESFWESDQVIGHMTADEVIKWMYAASQMKISTKKMIKSWMDTNGPKSIWQINDKYYYVSSSSMPNSYIPIHETMAFLCEKDGSVISWLEVYCGDYDVSHEEVADFLLKENNEQAKKD